MIKFAKILATALKTGVVTVKYPFEKPLVTDSFRGAIEVDPSKCIGCGACTQACPSRALSLVTEDNVVVLRYFLGRCIFCGVCVEVCPERAIRLTRDFELASQTLSDLYSDVEHVTKVCAMCGKPYTTNKMVSRVQETCPSLLGEIYDFCPECRMKRAAIRLLKFKA